jgi:hypothetical protein
LVPFSTFIVVVAMILTTRDTVRVKVVWVDSSIDGWHSGFALRSTNGTHSEVKSTLRLLAAGISRIRHKMAHGWHLAGVIARTSGFTVLSTLELVNTGTFIVTSHEPFFIL